MPSATLTNRALVSVAGPDAEHLLQNVITTDLDTLAAGEAKPGALLTPQGKILFDFLVSRSGQDGFLLECRHDIAAELVRRLTLYRLRAKAEIRKLDQDVVTLAWEVDSDPSRSDSTGERQTPPDPASSPEPSGVDSSSPANGLPANLKDARFSPPARVRRSYGSQAATAADVSAWEAFRIAQGVPEGGADYPLGDAFPHDVLLDQIGGVGFRKGCYVGQEVVSRMQHRGTARRRAVLAEASGPVASGSDVTVGGRSIGTLGSTVGRSAIAIVRLDKAKAAIDAGLPIMAGAAQLSLSIQPWAKFSFPAGADAAEER